MILFLKLIPLRFWLCLGLSAVLSMGALRLRHMIYQQGYERARLECVTATDKANELAQEQRDKQAATARAAADDYEKQAAITETKLKAARHDLYKATENLATCKLSRVAVGVLNDAGDYGTTKP